MLAHISLVFHNVTNVTNVKICISFADHLRTRLKIHSGEKSNKCNKCEYASSHAGHLKTHLITHSGEKSNKCNKCDYASAHAGHLRRHSKRHNGEETNKSSNADALMRTHEKV